MNFVIIAYYTKGTRYQQYAQRLKESLKKLTFPGFLYDIQAVENLGTWKKNTHYKAIFIKEMLARHGLPVLYVDADSIFHKYPSLIAKLPDLCDVAAHYFQGQQLNSAVLFFNNTLIAQEILDDWIQKNQGNHANLDQANLQEILTYLRAPHFFKLPPEYCKIFDLMPEVNDPVIEQFQASRLLRYDAAIALQEKDKYSRHWKSGYQSSICATPLAFHIAETAQRTQRLLDIGCGNGITSDILRQAGFHCEGVDITLDGVKNSPAGLYYHEAPVWQMPFEDDAYDFTFSTDTLEHVPPEMIDTAVQEIFRVTKQKTFHVIATFSHDLDGQEMHLTIQPIEWWKEKFKQFNHKNIDCCIISRGDFIRLTREIPSKDIIHAH